MSDPTKLCDFSKLPRSLHRYDKALDMQTGKNEWSVVLVPRESWATELPRVFTSTNKFDIRLAIREANEILSAIQRLKG